MTHASRILVTGFGPFDRVPENPSARLAMECGYPFQVLEVSYAAVDDFLTTVDPTTFDTLISLGIRRDSSVMHLEAIGHNRSSRAVDVRGKRLPHRQIERGGPWRRPASAWQYGKFVAGDKDFELSRRAGSYLCNYLLYRALATLPDKRVGFVHVPPFEKMAFERQLNALQRLLDKL